MGNARWDLPASAVGAGEETGEEEGTRNSGRKGRAIAMRHRRRSPAQSAIIITLARRRARSVCVDTRTSRRGTQEAAGSESGGGGQSETPRELTALQENGERLGNAGALFMVTSLCAACLPPRFHRRADDAAIIRVIRVAHAGTQRASPLPPPLERRWHAGNWRNWLESAEGYF